MRRHPQILARNSYVDESLFGCSHRPASAGKGKPASPSVGAKAVCGAAASASASASASPLRGSPAAAPALGKEGVVVLSQAQLDRLREVRAGLRGKHTDRLSH